MYHGLHCKTMSRLSRNRKSAVSPDPIPSAAAAGNEAVPAAAAGGGVRVCVVGAGVCGLAAIKAAKENGFDVDAFESSDGIGGLWRYDEKRHGVAAFTHINVSKHNYCFSDFPFDDSVPDYPHHCEMLRYLEAYASHFGLLPHITFNTTVQSVSLADDGGAVQSVSLADDGGAGRGVIVRTSSAEGGSCTRRYDFIMIASGHHVTPLSPHFPGLESFRGHAMHSISCAAKHVANSPAVYASHTRTRRYKKPQGFEGKRVVVVGIGNSGVDIATSLVGTAASVQLSSRRHAPAAAHHYAPAAAHR